MVFWIVALLGLLVVLALSRPRNSDSVGRGGLHLSSGHRWSLIYLIIASIVMILLLTKSPFLFILAALILIGAVTIGYGTRKLTDHMSSAFGSLDDHPTGSTPHETQNGRKTTSPGAVQMNRHQALDVLGLPPNASRADIEREYKRLMQQLHPDRGGNTYFAMQLNNARDSLLSSPKPETDSR